MLRETLKQAIGKLSESQLRKIADLVVSFKTQAKPLAKEELFWQRATPTERAPTPLRGS